jgi:small subunit ribosomal protein S4
MNYTGPKVKLSRKLSLELTLKARKVIAKKPYPPGQHGANKRRSKQSDFGKQLLEKQRLRLQYNISEKQMNNYYEKAARMVGNTADKLIQLLEARLDSVVYRAGLAPTIYAARQYVAHGHVIVNGINTDIPCFHVKVNDLITLKPKSKNLACFQDSIRNAMPPAYLELSKAEFSVKFVYVPPREEVPVICEMPLVVEYYSR